MSARFRYPLQRPSNSKPRRYNGYECLCVAVLQCAVREQASVEAEMLRTTNPCARRADLSAFGF